jgi:hypothetical protein
MAQVGFSQETVTKNLGDFDSVKVFDKISVQLIPSDENKMEISGNNNADVEIVNKNGELKIRMPFGKMLSGDDVTALLYFKKIENIEASEGAYISSEKPLEQISLAINSKEGSEIKLKLEVQKVTVRINSGGTIELEGTAQNQDIVISSGGDLKKACKLYKQPLVSMQAVKLIFVLLIWLMPRLGREERLPFSGNRNKSTRKPCLAEPLRRVIDSFFKLAVDDFF